MPSKLKIELSLSPSIEKIQQVFKKHNYNLYLVGGAVRDVLLNKPIKDYDLATDALPNVVEQLMRSSGFRTISTGKAFGVINVVTPDGQYEIATFRKDIGKGRRPDSVEFTSIENDVQRRDLTINGLFYDIENKEIIDLVGGIDDLKNKIVRTIGNPTDRFDEDKLRILRALRFAGRFNSSLHPDIHDVLKAKVSLEGVSPERIRDEFLKGIKTSKSVKYFLSLISEYQLWDEILPELIINTMFIENRDAVVVLAVLLSKNDIADLPKKLNKLSYTKNEIKGVVFLLNLLSLDIYTAYDLKMSQKNSGVNENQILDFGKFMGISTKFLQAFNQYNLSVKGKELIQQLGLTSGKGIGELIKSKEAEIFKNLLS